VSAGIYSIPLNFGAASFDGADRLLQVEVRPGASAGAYEVLSPRLPLGSAPYATYAHSAGAAASLALPFSGSVDEPGNAFEVTNTGLGRAGRFEISNAGNPEAAVAGVSLGSGPGGLFLNDSGGPGLHAISPLGIGLYARSDATANFARAIHGVLTTQAPGVSSAAIRGEHQSTGGSGFGMWGSHEGSGTGVYGSSVGAGFGVYGATNGGRGVYGRDFTNAGHAGYFMGRGYFSGLLGLNTEAPDERLHVAGDVKIVSSSDVDATLGSGALYILRGLGDRGLHMDENEIQTIGTPLLVNDQNIQETEINSTVWVKTNGNVGLGTSSPANRLTVSGSMNLTGNLGIGYVSPTNRLSVLGDANITGKLGIGLGAAGADLHVSGAENDGATAAVRITSGTQNLYLEGNEIDSDFSGLYLNHNNTGNVILGTGGGNVGVGTSNPQQKLHVNGTARVKVLEIEGADLAEQFQFSEEVEPGMVVAIDPDNPGRLCLARGSYNPSVAGVIAGANDFSTGVVLGKGIEGAVNRPVALSGRVWVMCDATNGAITPGRMLTTSDRPGHAMAATDRDRSHGAVLGKAMTSLAQGETGMVLVLVNLQ